MTELRLGDLESAPDMLTLVEYSRLTRRKLKTARADVFRRRVTYVKLHGKVLIPKAEVKRLIAEGMVPARRAE